MADFGWTISKRIPLMPKLITQGHTRNGAFPFGEAPLIRLDDGRAFDKRQLEAEFATDLDKTWVSSRRDLAERSASSAARRGCVHG